MCTVRENDYGIFTYRKDRLIDIGGGVAIIYNNNLDLINVTQNSYQSFEHLQCKLNTKNCPITFI